MNERKIGIIDYGIGSSFSLINSLASLNEDCKICKSSKEICQYDYLILPGVGNFKSAMKLINAGGWDLEIKKFCANRKKRFLGICLGFQLLFEYSSESNPIVKGLSILKGNITELKSGHNIRIPHIGWNNIKIIKKGDFLNNSLGDVDLYFVHSYAFCQSQSKKLDQFNEYSISTHGNNNFISSFRSGNIYACQFHPEKSSYAGKAFLEAFLK